MVLYLLLTTYNSNAFSLLLTPYYFTTYYLTTYYLLPYYLLPYYLTTLLLTPLLLPPPSNSLPPRTVRRTIHARIARLADLLKSDREADLVRVPS